MKRFVIALLIIGAIGAGAGAYYLRRNDVEVGVLTAPVTRGDVVDTVGATGTLQAVTTVQVGSQVSGNIQYLGADFNSIVKKGQIIARLDPSLFQAQLEQSKAGLNQAKANLTKAQSDLDRMKVQLLDSQQKYARMKELFDKQLETQSDLDAAKIAVDSAQASLASQQATVAQVGASISQAEASVNQNQVNLDHTVIEAPIDGIITQRSVDVGQTVAASMQAPTLFIIAADLTKMQVNASIDEADVGRIRPDQHVTFRVDAYPTETFEGTVAQIRLQPVVVQNVTTYGTVINVPNPQLKLKPGMTATVKVEVAHKTDVLRVPNTAVRFRPNNEMFAAFNQPVPPEVQFGGARGGRGAGGGRGQGGGANAAGNTGAPAAQPTTATAGAAPGSTAAAGPNPARGNRASGGGSSADAAAPGAAASAEAGVSPEGRRGRGFGQGGGSQAQGGGSQSGQGDGGQGGGGQGGGGRGRGGGGNGAGGNGGRDGGNPAANAEANPGDRRAQQLERFKAMPPDQQQQFIERLKGRGQDVSAFQAAVAPARGAAARRAAAPAGPALTAPKKGGPQGPETIDALFAPLPEVETRGRVWLFVDKQLKPVNVRLGITDGTNTELLSGELQPNMEVVTGVTGIGSVRPLGGFGGGNNGNPLLGNRGGGPPGRGR